MAIAVGDILELTDVQTYLGQVVLNVYQYEVVEWGPDTELEDVANAFQTFVTTYLRTIQNIGLVHTRVIIKNLTNGIDIYEEPWTQAGESAGAPMPSFVGWSFRLIRTTLDTRHGAKRIAGVTEESTTGNDPASGALTPLATVATQMGLPLNIDSGGDTDFIAAPVIVGRVPTGSPGAGEYDLSRINPVSAVQFIRISTQTTRRAGRGV